MHCCHTFSLRRWPIARAALIFNYGNLISESPSGSYQRRQQQHEEEKKTHICSVRSPRLLFIKSFRCLLDWRLSARKRPQITGRESKQVSFILRSASFWRINNLKYDSFSACVLSLFFCCQHQQKRLVASSQRNSTKKN